MYQVYVLSEAWVPANAGTHAEPLYVRTNNVLTYAAVRIYIIRTYYEHTAVPYVYPGTRSAHPRIPGDTMNPSTDAPSILDTPSTEYARSMEYFSYSEY